MMMMSNGGGGAGDGDGNDNGRKRKKDDQEEEEDKAADFPVGYKFEPNDEELIKYYLYPKIKKLPLPQNNIKDVNIYFYNPWDLTETYGSFYFFTSTKRKRPNGIVLNRTANGGNWKASGSERPIIDNDTKKEIGYKKVLLFKPRRSKMNEILSENQIGWHMFEYTLKKDNDEKNKSPWTEDGGSNNNKQLDELVLCKIVYSKPPRKYKKDRAVDVATPPSNATTKPSVAAAVPENHHHNHHFVCQTDVAAADHRCPLTSMVLEMAAPPEMMPFNVNPFSSSVILPPVNHHYYGEMNQQRLQSTILPSVNHHYYGEMMNQQQLQSAMLPSVNYHTDAQMNEQQLQPAMLSSVNQHSEMNQQQLQMAALPSVNHRTYGQMNQQQLPSAILPSVNHQHHGEMMNQQQLQPAVLPSVNHPTYGQMNQQQLQPAVLPSVNHPTYGQMNQQQLQPAVLPSVNHPIDGQMNQQQLQEKADWEMLYAAWFNDTDYFLKLRQ